MLCLTTLPTLAALEKFWELNRGRYGYASLSGYSWIFGSEKHVVMRSLLNWDENQTFVYIRDNDWFLVNGPTGMTKSDLLGGLVCSIDPSNSSYQTTCQVLSLVFDHWRAIGDDLFDAASLDAYIVDWRAEHDQGRDYYGSENEVQVRSPALAHCKA